MSGIHWLSSLARWCKGKGWIAAAIAAAVIFLLPIGYVMLSLMRVPNENWAKVKQYLVADYVTGTLKLVLFTGFFATVLGVSLAWLVTRYSFAFSHFYRWALIAPLALPPYIAAYTYRTMTSYTGFIQATLRSEFDVVMPPRVFEVVSLRGAVFVLSLTLFPYVFIITRTFLERQGAAYIENAQLLGRSGWTLFLRVVLPLARPALIAGMMLVVFEVLSDFGVASYFGIQTLSTAIFQTWFGMYDVDSAMRLAAWLMVAVLGVFVLERYLRRSQRYYTTIDARPIAKRRLRGGAAALASSYCGLVFVLAFAVPVAQLVVWSFWTFEKVWRNDMLHLLTNSVKGAFIAACCIAIFSLFISYAVRRLPAGMLSVMSRLMTIGYAVPGAVIAIGVLAIFIMLDKVLSPLYVTLLGMHEGALVLSLSFAMLLAGYVVRFFAVGFNAVETGYDKLQPAYMEASRTLGRSRLATFLLVELPLLRGAVLAGLVLSFVDIVKELPLTLLLRPFNYDTLATRTYQYAVDERIYEAAPLSLLLVLIGLLSIGLINRFIKER